MTYSRGYHDSLSVYYLEALKFNEIHPKEFLNLLELYNIHYVAFSELFIDHDFIEECQLQEIASFQETVVYSVHSDDEAQYGYFDFVRTPGYVDGNLRILRSSVQDSLEMYQSNALLALNPRTSNPIRHHYDVAVDAIYHTDGDFGGVGRKAYVIWEFDGDASVNSQDVIDSVVEQYESDWVLSHLVEEAHLSSGEFHAVVHMRHDNPHEVGNNCPSLPILDPEFI